MARQQGCDQRVQRVEVGRQVDIHVDEDVGTGSGPRVLEGAPAALLVQPDGTDIVVLMRELACQQICRIGAGIVGDRDPEGERHRPEVVPDGRHRLDEGPFLVEDRYDDVEDRGQDVPVEDCRGCERLAHTMPPDRS